MSVSAPTILIVDDEAQNRRLLAVLLRPEGYHTESAASGAEALTAIAQSAPDLILPGIMMSSRIRSGADWAIAVSASAPLAALSVW